MRKLIAGINITVDGICDHTAGVADEELHEHYTNALKNAGTILWGRTTFQLMESYWPTLEASPSGDAAMDDFATAASDITKVVYSRTLTSTKWRNTEIKKELTRDDILTMKQQDGKPILAGSPSLIVQLSQMGLVDEYQLCIHPVILGSGLSLFKGIAEQIDLKLLDTKIFGSGAVVHYYQPTKR